MSETAEEEEEEEEEEFVSKVENGPGKHIRRYGTSK